MSACRPTSFAGWFCVFFAFLAAQGPLPARADPQQLPKPAAADAAETQKVELRIFRLKYTKAAEAARILGELFGDRAGPKARIRLSTDDRTNSLIVSARAADMIQVEAILSKIDGPDVGELNKEYLGSLQVTVFWLVSGARRGATDLPDSLKEMTKELAGLGLARPRLAARLAINTVVNGRFETRGTVPLTSGYDVSISGTVTEKSGKLELSLTASAAQASRRGSSRTVASLRTQVAVSLDRTVVLGVVPTDTLTSAFVVQIVRAKPGQPAKKASPPAKKVSFEFHNKPWREVFTWLSDQTGKPVIGSSPTGAFTFVGPKGKTYTIPEVIDIINEALLANSPPRKYYLLNRERCFTLVPADEKVDPEMVPRIPVEDLAEHGRTELVSIVLKLKRQRASDLVPEIKKMMGPCGDVAALGNQLVLLDTAGNLRRVCELIKELDKKSK